LSTVTAQVPPSSAAASRAKLRASEKLPVQAKGRTASLSPAMSRALSRLASLIPVSITRQTSTQDTTERRASTMMSSLLLASVVEMSRMTGGYLGHVSGAPLSAEASVVRSHGGPAVSDPGAPGLGPRRLRAGSAFGLLFQGMRGHRQALGEATLQDSDSWDVRGA